MSDLPAPRQPYRAAVVFHAILAGVILLVAAISGGDLVKTLGVALAYFVAATGWSWFRFRQRETLAAAGRSSGGDGGEKS